MQNGREIRRLTLCLFLINVSSKFVCRRL